MSSNIELQNLGNHCRPGKTRVEESIKLNNITILRSGAIGDFVLTLPAIDAIHKAFPTKDLRLIGNPATLALYGNAAHLDHDDPRLIALHSDGPIPAPTRALFADCERALAYAVDPQGQLQRRLTQLVTGPVLLWDPRPTVGTNDHIVDHLLRPLAQWSIPICSRTPHIAADQYRTDIPPQIVIHPGSGSPTKCWPKAQFAALYSALERRGLHAALLCGPVELERDFNNDCPTICPPDLSALATLLASARLFIGNDSGPGHIAAAVGTPTLSLFGPTDPRIWSPRHSRSRILQRPDITDIPLSAVVDVALQMLEKTPHG